MEATNKFSSSKISKVNPNSVANRSSKNGQSPPVKMHNEKRGHKTEQVFARRVCELLGEDTKHRVPLAQVLPMMIEKSQFLSKPLLKEQTKPLNFRLHTEQRAARRAGFNDLVASKTNSLEILRRFEERILKVIEEEEIKIMRKEMVPKAQLMPIFDRPFFPQRSKKPLTVPREPSFLKLKCCIGGEFHRHFCYNMKAVK
ncbi:protein TPX2 isoform X1 [Ananas comosus]|uniref:Protein TPX2 isoform X1 n=1 Tax=Ananas comosus TaxID=4615 RepID=A0A6P5G1L9_ANACO|nr:protein TPX2 isoform X1 [Ananas comosus]